MLSLEVEELRELLVVDAAVEDDEALQRAHDDPQRTDGRNLRMRLRGWRRTTRPQRTRVRQTAREEADPRPGWIGKHRVIAPFFWNARESNSSSGSRFSRSSGRP
jgi:hypothetical protein